MNELRKTLDNGVELVVQMGSWEESHRLYKAVMAVVEKSSIQKDEMINFVARMTISDPIDAALWSCMGRATYGGAKITKSTFEDVTAREYYLVIAKEVLVYNLLPFFKHLNLLLPEMSAMKSISTPK